MRSVRHGGVLLVVSVRQTPVRVSRRSYMEIGKLREMVEEKEIDCKRPMIRQWYLYTVYGNLRLM